MDDQAARAPHATTGTNPGRCAPAHPVVLPAVWSVRDRDGHPMSEQATVTRQAQRATEAGFTWPEGWTPSDLGIRSARECRQQILWCTTRAGKPSPVNPDSTSHFASCPAATSFRKPR